MEIESDTTRFNLIYVDLMAICLQMGSNDKTQLPTEPVELMENRLFDCLSKTHFSYSDFRRMVAYGKDHRLWN